MKKFTKIALPFVLLFSILTANINTADAMSYSSGRSSFSSSSFKSSSSSFRSTPKSSYSTSTSRFKSSSTSKTGTGYKINKNTGKITKPTRSTIKDTTKSNIKTPTKTKYKKIHVATTYKYNSKSKYYKPKGHHDYHKYEGTSFFNPATGFATGLITGVGAYLLLEGLDNDGNPIYTDSNTGQQVSADDLNNMDVQQADSNDISTATNQQNDTNGWMIFSVILLGLILAGGLTALFVFMKK